MAPEYNERPVRVDFPSSMKIESPELDAVKKSTTTIAKILSNHLQRIAADIQSLTALPDLFRELKKLVADQFNNLFKAQVESNIMNRQATIKVLEKKISFVEQHVNRKKEQLEKTNNQITTRFKNISGEMTKEHELFLQKLDSHAYSIVDQIYPRQVKERFSYDSQPNIDYLVNHALESAYVRTKCLTDSYNDARNSVENFLEERNIFYNELKQHGIESNMEEGLYNFPIFFAEILNNESGETETKLFYPWENNGIDVETSSTLEHMVLESLDELNNQQTNNPEIEAELLDWLKDNKIPEKEYLRFKEDCKNLIIEEN